MQIRGIDYPAREEWADILRTKRQEYALRLEEMMGDSNYSGHTGHVMKIIRERNPRLIHDEREKEFAYWLRQMFKKEIIDTLLANKKVECQEHYKGLIKKFPGLEIKYLKTYLDSARLIEDYCKTGGAELKTQEVKTKQ